MRAELTIKDPGNLEATIAITLRLREWIEVQKALKDAPHYGPTRKACGVLRFDVVEGEA